MASFIQPRKCSVSCLLLYLKLPSAAEHAPATSHFFFFFDNMK